MYPRFIVAALVAAVVAWSGDHTTTGSAPAAAQDKPSTARLGKKIDNVTFQDAAGKSFVLHDLHRFLTANKVAYRHEDPARVQRLFDQLGPEQVLEQTFWRSELSALVLIDPNGAWRSRQSLTSSRLSTRTAGRIIPSRS